jgi:hypothetical protein
MSDNPATGGKRYELFKEIQRKQYFLASGKKGYTRSIEENLIENIIHRGWEESVVPEQNALAGKSERELIAFFETIRLEFPIFSDDDLSDQTEDEYIDLDDIEEFDEIMEEDIDSFSRELDSIPDENREDVLMLMLAFPALQTIGFPITVFLSGDGGAQLTDRQRQQIDWARQLAYKVVEMIETKKKSDTNKLQQEAERFAAAFVPKDKIRSVIDEIREAYVRGKP